jgi:hypothetical protein
MDDTTSLRLLSEVQNIAKHFGEIAQHTRYLEELGPIAAQLDAIRARLDTLEQAIKLH